MNNDVVAANRDSHLDNFSGLNERAKTYTPTGSTPTPDHRATGQLDDEAQPGGRGRPEGSDPLMVSMQSVYFVREFKPTHALTASGGTPRPSPLKAGLCMMIIPDLELEVRLNHHDYASLVMITFQRTVFGGTPWYHRGVASGMRRISC